MEDRQGYYTALEAWDRGQDLNPLRDYLREQAAKAWEKQIVRAEQKMPKLP